MTQAHFHTFDIPQGAVHLAYSPLNPKQAVRHGDKTYAFQFHPECTIEGFQRCWPNASAHCGKSGAQSREEQAEMMALDDAKQADWFYDALSKLFGTA